VQLGYDGDRFYGVTPQPNLRTVHDALATRVWAAAGTRPRALVFAARTDRGVHARANLATLWLPTDADRSGLLEAIAAPRDDGVTDVTVFRVSPHVFARSLAVGKRYRYRFETGWDCVPYAGRSWQIWPRVDVDRIRDGARHLLGTHNFRSMAVRPTPNVDLERTITRLTVEHCSVGGHQTFELVVEGDGFLRRMVRTIVGTLVEVGVGLREPSAVPAILGARDRRSAGMLAPARGLMLDQILTGQPLVDLALPSNRRMPSPSPLITGVL
jgi:tRNA pseudouridine38-40 synthase